MNIKHLLIGVSLSLMCASCADDRHFVTDPAVREEIERDFQAKQKALPHGGLFDWLGRSMPAMEKEALTFLYAYMPVGDATDYTADFYLDNVRAAFLAREEMPWGNAIPEDIFRHFVLPVRVNNENMDESRMVFYKELRDRVKGLSLYDAVLEVNHWCHEKVIYTPSDSRTSSPLASVRTAYGRCGEESVFAVAALRAVGIPARQVYTPRWAHTDDNHAWVEAWVDGKWYFMGACEPEPVLNLAWFNEPVARGMLMHTKVFGRYNGPEDVMEQTNCYTEINVTGNYAPVAPVTVIVTDEQGNPLQGAQVEFKIYNYAEFYTVSRKQTGNDGQAALSAGKGDMLVWAAKGERYAFRKVSFGKDSTVTLVLPDSKKQLAETGFEIIPPVEGRIGTQVTEEQKAANMHRLHQEDSIRSLYVATFYTEEKAKALAGELNADPALITRYMLASRGNWAEIEAFLRKAPGGDLSKALEVLKTISAKDLRDAPAAVLSDHLQTSYPRVSNEMLTAYRSFFRNAVNGEQVAQYRADPQKLVGWVRENINVRNDLNPQRIPISPSGVWKARVADSHSRDIFFISLAKSLDIKARIEPVTRKVQYAVGDDTWTDVDFESAAPGGSAQGRVIVSYKPSKALQNPKYYSHFTIARILPGGELQTLDFRSGSADMGGGNTWAALFGKPVSMDEGDYLLIAGTRMAKGNVLGSITPFSVRKEETAKVNLVMRENPDDIRVLGSLDAEAMFEQIDGKQTSILNTTGRGYFIIGILGARQEPSNHAMRDISAVADKFNGWGRSMILLFKDRQNWEKYDKNEFGALPGTITYGIDNNQAITKMILSGLNMQNTDNLPLFVIADTFGRIVFVSQGYTIGVGERMVEVVNKL